MLKGAIVFYNKEVNLFNYKLGGTPSTRNPILRPKLNVGSFDKVDFYLQNIYIKNLVKNYFVRTITKNLNLHKFFNLRLIPG